MHRILLAHDWFGPDYPLTNNECFAKHNPIGIGYFKSLGGFERLPSALISEHDPFIYEIYLTFKENEWLRQDDIDLLSTTSISEKTLEKIKYKNGFLLLNLGEESVVPAYADSLFDKIHNFCKKEEISLSKVIFQIGNISAKEMYKDYCFRNGVTGGEHGTEFLNISPVEYFEYKVSYTMNEPYMTAPARNISIDAIKKTFMCLNRQYRPHRFYMLLSFYKNNLLENSYFSMPERCIYDLDTKWKDHKWISDIRKKGYIFTDQDLDDIQKLLPLNIDTNEFTDFLNPHRVHRIWEGMEEYYKSSLISVVTETNFECNTVFNTEKTFKPIANRHPFIMVGPKGTLARLREMGYQTFSDFWDESYDDIEDPFERLAAIEFLLYSINEWTETEKKLFFYRSMKITNHNYDLLKDVATKFMINRNEFWHGFKYILSERFRF